MAPLPLARIVEVSSDAGGMQSGKTLIYRKGDARASRFIHDAAFASVRWTSIHDQPANRLLFLFGDCIAGPIAKWFGKGIVDVKIEPRRRSNALPERLFTHTIYWEMQQPHTNGTPLSVRVVRNAVNLRGKIRELIGAEFDVPIPRDDSAAIEVMTEAHLGFGMRAGYCIPIHSLTGYQAGVSFAGREADQTDEANSAMNIIGIYAVNRLTNMRSKGRSLPVLSVREREVLSWTAAGKTDRDTGEILDIQEDTVTPPCSWSRLRSFTRPFRHFVRLRVSIRATLYAGEQSTIGQVQPST